MTDFDKALIEKANRITRRDYRDIDTLTKYAAPEEARLRLLDIRWLLCDLLQGTL